MRLYLYPLIGSLALLTACASPPTQSSAVADSPDSIIAEIPDSPAAFLEVKAAPNVVRDAFEAEVQHWIDSAASLQEGGKWHHLSVRLSGWESQTLYSLYLDSTLERVFGETEWAAESYFGTDTFVRFNGRYQVIKEMEGGERQDTHYGMYLPQRSSDCARTSTEDAETGAFSPWISGDCDKVGALAYRLDREWKDIQIYLREALKATKAADSTADLTTLTYIDTLTTDPGFGAMTSTWEFEFDEAILPLFE